VVFVLVIYKAFIGFSWSVNFFQLFGVRSNLGLVSDYKLLLGNTSLSDINSTRVNSNYFIARPINYNSASWEDVGPLSVRFVRRDLAYYRKTLGPIRYR